jgi:galactose mutarotase-like enzyme
MRLAVLPELGGKIVSLRDIATDFDWLWHHPALPMRRPMPGESYVEHHDTGGWDEILPTVDPCRVPGSPWGDEPLTDHGVLWGRLWHAGSCDDQSVSLQLHDAGLPIAMSRRIELAAGAGPLRIDYELTNRTDQPLPFIWAAHPLIAIEPGMRIELPHRPDGSTMATCVGGACSMIDTRSIPLHTPFRWPHLGALDLSMVPPRDAQPLAVKIFTEPVMNPSITLTRPADRGSLTMTLHADHPHALGLWLNFGAWSGSGDAPYFNAGIEPTTSPADRLDTALSAGSAAMLAPRATRRWSIAVHLSS